LDAPEYRAAASLRSALWRLHRPAPPVVEASATHLRLSPLVGVDAREMLAEAHALLDPSSQGQAGQLDVADFSGELLPGWYDEWVIFERERLRQVRLHALEALCDRLVGEGLFGAAVEAALTAVAAEPLRESAHRALIRAYLAEGNRAEAIHHFRRYRRLLRDELELDPSPEIVDLVHDLPVG
jgi:DNA-binding SARP family transcriptional activator